MGGLNKRMEVTKEGNSETDVRIMYMQTVKKLT